MSQTQKPRSKEKFSGEYIKIAPRNDTIRVAPSPYRELPQSPKKSIGSPKYSQPKLGNVFKAEPESQNDQDQLKGLSSKSKRRQNAGENSESMMRLHRVKPETAKLPYIFYMKACSQYWKAMSEEEKEPYTKLADEDKQRHEKQYEQYLHQNDFKISSQNDHLNGQIKSEKSRSPSADSNGEGVDSEDPDVDSDLEWKNDIKAECGATYVISQRKSAKEQDEKKEQPNKKGKGKRKNYRDPKKPKRIMGAYQYFLKEKLNKTVVPNSSQQDGKRGGVVAYLASVWNKMSEREKKPYTKLHVKDKNRYTLEYSQYLENEGFSANIVQKSDELLPSKADQLNQKPDEEMKTDEPAQKYGHKNAKQSKKNGQSLSQSLKKKVDSDLDQNHDSDYDLSRETVSDISKKSQPIAKSQSVKTRRAKAKECENTLMIKDLKKQAKKQYLPKKKSARGGDSPKKKDGDGNKGSDSENMMEPKSVRSANVKKQKVDLFNELDDRLQSQENSLPGKENKRQKCDQ